MADIFISYSSSDREKAKALAEAIQQQGWSVWWDRKIPYGKSFDQVIEQELDAARCVVVVWTKMSVASDWVKTEAAEGARRHVLLPVFLDDVKIPLEFRRLQAANLTDWQPGLPNSQFDQLLTYVGEMLGKPTLADPGEPEVNLLAGGTEAETLFAKGEQYYHGNGVPQNYAEAAKWYHKAADRNHPGAQKKLAQMYRDGVGVGKNEHESLKWEMKVLEQQQKESSKTLDEMNKKALDTIGRIKAG